MAWWLDPIERTHPICTWYVGQPSEIFSKVCPEDFLAEMVFSSTLAPTLLGMLVMCGMVVDLHHDGHIPDGKDA